MRSKRQRSRFFSGNIAAWRPLAWVFGSVANAGVIEDSKTELARGQKGHRIDLEVNRSQDTGESCVPWDAGRLSIPVVNLLRTPLGSACQEPNGVPPCRRPLVSGPGGGCPNSLREEVM